MKRQHLLQLAQFSEKERQHADIHLSIIKGQIQHLNGKIARAQHFYDATKIPELLLTGDTKSKDRNKKLRAKKTKSKNIFQKNIVSLDAKLKKINDIYDALMTRRFAFLVP